MDAFNLTAAERRRRELAKVRAKPPNGNPRTIDARLREMARDRRWFWQLHPLAGPAPCGEPVYYDSARRRYRTAFNDDAAQWRRLAAEWGIDAATFDRLTSNTEHWAVYHAAQGGGA